MVVLYNCDSYGVNNDSFRMALIGGSTSVSYDNECGVYTFALKLPNGGAWFIGCGYYCDNMWFNNSNLHYFSIGASTVNSATAAGVFACGIDAPYDRTSWNLGCAKL